MLDSAAKILLAGNTPGAASKITEKPFVPPTSWNEIVSGCVIDTNNAKDVATLQCIPAVFSLVLTFVFGLAGIAAVFFVLFAGFKFLTSGGDPKQVQGARQTLTYAIIGLIVIILSYAILNLISQITGVDCILKFGFGAC